MRKIHVYINDVPVQKGAYNQRDEILSILLDLEEPVRNELYSGVRRPFRPFHFVKQADTADIALLFLTDKDIPAFKELYYRMYVKGTPIFLVILAGTEGDPSFREVLFERHPHFVVEHEFRQTLKLKEYLSDFFLRELKKVFVPRFSRVDPESLIRNYERDWSCFVQPPDYDRVLETLSKHHFVVLYGPSNSGKSCLARNILKQYHERGYHLNEVLTPNFTPHMFMSVLRSPERVITLFDNDSYSFEWEWQVSPGILNLFLATIEKWADSSHPVIFVLSGKKMHRMLDRLVVDGWPDINAKLVLVPPFQLSPELVDTVLEKHLHYYTIASVRHQELFSFFRGIYSQDLTPSLIFYTLRFAIMPQGPSSLERLKKQKKLNLYNPKRIFQYYLQSSSMKEKLILYLLLATELEINRVTFESLIKEIYHFSLFIGGNIVDFTPHHNQWIEHLFNDLNGAVFRRYKYDDEEHLVFSHRLFRSAVSRYFKQQSSRKSHKIIGEAIVDYLMNLPSFQGTFFAIRFLLLHLRSFSPEYRKKVFYHFVREEDRGDQSFIIPLLYQFYYLIGKEGLATLKYLSQSDEQSLREEHAHAFGIFYTQTNRNLDRLIKSVLDDDNEQVQRSFMESVGLGFEQLTPPRKKTVLKSVENAAPGVKYSFLFGLLHNFISLDASELNFVRTLMAEKTDTCDKALARAFLFFPVSVLISGFESEFARLARSDNGFVRSRMVGSFAGRLNKFPEHLVSILFELTNDPSPLVRKEVATILIKNYRHNPDHIYQTLVTMLRSEEPYLRASVSSVIIELFSVFSSEQQARFLRHFLQFETIEGIRKSITDLIGSHFHLIKSATEDLFFQSLEWNEPQTRANIAEQILAYYDQLKPSTQDLLLKLVCDRDERVRMKVVSLISKHCLNLPNARLHELFNALLDDNSEFIRSQLAAQLAVFGKCLSRPELEGVINRMLDDTEMVRTSLARSILTDQKIFGQFYDPILIKIERDLSKQVRLALLKQIRKIKGHLPEEHLVRILETFARDTSSDIRFETVQLIIDLAIFFSDDVRHRVLPLLTGLEGESGAIISHELEMAAEIQGNLLPKRLPRLEGYRFSFLFSPARAIGGDFIGFFPLDEGRLGIAMGDISGKGIPAALLMANFHALLKAQINADPEPTSVTTRLNTLFKESSLGNKFVSFVYGILDRTRATFEYVNAGHNYPMVYSATTGFTRLNIGGPVLGVFDGEQFTSETITLPEGATLLMFTDGITESRDDQDNEFGEEKLMDIVVKNSELLPKKLVDVIEHELHLFSNVLVPFDDISLIVIKRI